jgi:formate-dependent phosphoribosylglycinamide formyltransferase (GAR transformylase)
MISPGFPNEMPLFTKGLARQGATVIGLGEGPAAMMPNDLQQAMAAYLQVPSLWDDDAVIEQVRGAARHGAIHRVECLWEPGMLLAAKLREALGLPGMTVAETLPFRDKEDMKRVLDAADLRTPRHARCKNDDEVRAAAARIGYPLVIKPIAGAGSADTYRVDDEAELNDVMPRVRHVHEVSAEEFIEGEEYTFDTICVDGEILYHNLSHYRPQVLIGRSVEWVSPQTVALRDVHADELKGGVELGKNVLRALGFRTGFTHMEWFRTPKGEAVLGEIGCRPPGARSVDVMNYASDLDLFEGWAEAIVHRRFSPQIDRKYNAIVVFKRAQGQGRIRQIEGLDRLLHRYGSHVVDLNLLPIGAPRRNWKQTLLSDGSIVVRHPDRDTAYAIADAFGTDLQLHAG